MKDITKLVPSLSVQLASEMKRASLVRQFLEQMAKMPNSCISIVMAPAKPIPSSMGPAGEHSKPWAMSGQFSERLRAFEHFILAHLDEIRCPVHLSLGAEAVSEAIHRNVRKNDWLFSTHRNHGHYLAKGGNLDRLWDEICGLDTGINSGLAGSQCISDPAINFHASSIVGGSIGIAVGAAFALRGSGNIVVCCFGDAATEQGIFWESLNFAVLKKLPILFICENNSLSINVPVEERQAVPIFTRVMAWGLPVLTTDGPIDLQGPGVGHFEDRFELGFHYARKDEPCFIEARTKREGDHCYFPKP